MQLQLEFWGFLSSSSHVLGSKVCAIVSSWIPDFVNSALFQVSLHFSAVLIHVSSSSSSAFRVQFLFYSPIKLPID